MRPTALTQPSVLTGTERGRAEPALWESSVLLEEPDKAEVTRDHVVRAAQDAGLSCDICLQKNSQSKGHAGLGVADAISLFW